jgi:hypothetical protein
MKWNNPSLSQHYTKPEAIIWVRHANDAVGAWTRLDHPLRGLAADMVLHSGLYLGARVTGVSVRCNGRIGKQVVYMSSDVDIYDLNDLAHELPYCSECGGRAALREVDNGVNSPDHAVCQATWYDDIAGVPRKKNLCDSHLSIIEGDFDNVKVSRF